MTDDTCGHPTADGSPCQNPPTGGDSCWIPSHGGSANAGHRQSKFNDERAEKAKEAARQGMSKAGCARAAGVDRHTLERWLSEREGFRTAFMRARHEGEHRLVTEALWNDENAEREIDGQHARFLLSTSFDYVKTEKTEVEDVTEDGFGSGTEIVVTGKYDPNDVDD